LANAYRLQQIAKSSENSSDVAAVKQNFIAAAEAFKICSRPIKEASCYEVNIRVLCWLMINIAIRDITRLRD